MTGHEKNSNSITTNNSRNSRNNDTTSIGRTNTSSISIHTQPGVCQLSPSDLEDIRIAYKTSLSMPLTSTVAHFIENCLYAGMHADVVIEAINRTGWAKRPTPFYLRAILNRFLQAQILTMQDVKDDEEERLDFQRQAGEDAWKYWYVDYWRE